MDEEKRERRMEYPEERESLTEERMDEEKREAEVEYTDDLDTFIREPMDEELDEDMRERQRDNRDDRETVVSDRTDEETRRHEPADRTRREESREWERSSMNKGLVPLLDAAEAEEFRSRWLDIQADFVDDPRHSVESADELVARVINSITENFASERNALEDQWNRGEEASTEDLRIAIKRYRSFFNRLLTLESANAEE
jgi:hypothetical protein